ncbi:MAG: TraB/GumN family protein [Halarchaeum sp.]
MSEDARDGEGSVRLVGTAHVSTESVEDVERAIREEEPDAVAVELDEGRYRQMKGGEPDDIAPADLLRGSVALQFLAYWLLSYVQQRMGERFDIQPGADMLAAVETAEEVGSEVALVDRDIQVTIQRFWTRMTALEKLRLIGQLALALVGIGGDEEEMAMDDLTDGDVVAAMMEEFRRFSPGGAEALLDERDAYLAHNIHDLRMQGKDVVAVIGAGHRAGVESYLANPETLPPMASLTGKTEKRFSLVKAFGTLLTLGFLVFFALVLMAGVNNATIFRLFAAWFLFNGIIAAGLALLGGAHWTSAGVGGAVAWLTSLNPALAPGWFAGYVELRYTPVQLSDIGRLNELLSDETKPIRQILSEMTDVPLFRLIAVVALTNVGSFIASVLFIPLVLPLVGGDLGSASEVMSVLVAGAQNSLDLLRGLVA